MASGMRKMAVYLGLVEDDRYDDEDYDDRPYPERGEPRRSFDRGEDPVRGYDGRSYEEQPVEARRAEERGRAIAAVREPSRSSVSTMAERRIGTATAEAIQEVQPVPTTPSDVTRITTIHPRTYNEAKTVGEAFRDGVPVIMNLSDMQDSDAKRLVDFAAGLIFGLRGTIERVTNKVFLLSPANVTVTAEDKARIAESGFFNQS